MKDRDKTDLAAIEESFKIGKQLTDAKKELPVVENKLKAAEYHDKML